MCNLDVENSTNVSVDLGISKFNNSDKEFTFFYTFVCIITDETIVSYISMKSLKTAF